jgi:imidazolonepropionase
MKDCPSIAHQVIDVQGKCVMPAWCDSHTHIVFAQGREGEYVDRLQGKTYEEIAANGGGILNSAAKLQQKSEDELYESAKKRLDEVISYGTGAIEIKSG